MGLRLRSLRGRRGRSTGGRPASTGSHCVGDTTARVLRRSLSCVAGAGGGPPEEAPRSALTDLGVEREQKPAPSTSPTHRATPCWHPLQSPQFLARHRPRCISRPAVCSRSESHLAPGVDSLCRISQLGSRRGRLGSDSAPGWLSALVQPAVRAQVVPLWPACRVRGMLPGGAGAAAAFSAAAPAAGAFTVAANTCRSSHRAAYLRCGRKTSTSIRCRPSHMVCIGNI